MASILAALFFSLAILFVAGNACDQVPSMSWNEACAQSCNYSQAWVNLCRDTLSNGPPTAELTVFALAATTQAKLKYESTINTVINPAIGVGILPKDELVAVDLCKEKYIAARDVFANIIDQLSACDLTKAKQEYFDAEVGIRTCQNWLSPYPGLAELYSRVSADHEVTMVAYELGALIVGK